MLTHLLAVNLKFAQLLTKPTLAGLRSIVQDLQSVDIMTEILDYNDPPLPSFPSTLVRAPTTAPLSPMLGVTEPPQLLLEPMILTTPPPAPPPAPPAASPAPKTKKRKRAQGPKKPRKRRKHGITLHATGCFYSTRNLKRRARALKQRVRESKLTPFENTELKEILRRFYPGNPQMDGEFKTIPYHTNIHANMLICGKDYFSMGLLAKKWDTQKIAYVRTPVLSLADLAFGVRSKKYLLVVNNEGFKSFADYDKSL